LYKLQIKWDIKINIKRHVALMGETRNAYVILVGKPEGKRPLGRPRRRWVDNIKWMRWWGLDPTGSG
jgi:hypothetical protein